MNSNTTKGHATDIHDSVTLCLYYILKSCNYIVAHAALMCKQKTAPMQTGTADAVEKGVNLHAKYEQ